MLGFLFRNQQRIASYAFAFIVCSQANIILYKSVNFAYFFNFFYIVFWICLETFLRKNNIDSVNKINPFSVKSVGNTSRHLLFALLICPLAAIICVFAQLTKQPHYVIDVITITNSSISLLLIIVSWFTFYKYDNINNSQCKYILTASTIFLFIIFVTGVVIVVTLSSYPILYVGLQSLHVAAAYSAFIAFVFSLPVILYWVFNVKEISNTYIPIIALVVSSVLLAVYSGLYSQETSYCAMTFLIAFFVSIVIGQKNFFLLFVALSIAIFFHIVMYATNSTADLFGCSIPVRPDILSILFGDSGADMDVCKNVIPVFHTLHNIIVLPLVRIVLRHGVFYLSVHMLTAVLFANSINDLNKNIVFRKTLYILFYERITCCVRIGAFCVWFIVSLQYGVFTPWLNGVTVSIILLFVLINRVELFKMSYAGEDGLIKIETDVSVRC